MDSFTSINTYSPYLIWVQQTKLAILSLLLALPGGFSHAHGLPGPEPHAHILAPANYNLPGPTVTATGTGTTCEMKNGTITATGAGGANPYSYSINGADFQTNGLFGNLAAGTYTVTLKDALGQTGSADVTLANTYSAPFFSFTFAYGATCNSKDASIDVTGTGGTPPYLFSFDDINFTPNTHFPNLAAGAYALFERDANGCTAARVVNVINTCSFNFYYSSHNPGCSNDNGVVSIDPFGAAPYIFSLNGGPFQTNGTFEHLPAGIYIVTMQDADGVQASWGFSIYHDCAFSVSAIIANPACEQEDGSITASGQGGIPPYQYSLDGINFQTSNIFTGLAGGAYTVIMRDASGASAFQTVNLAKSVNTVTVDAGRDTTICQGATASFIPFSNATNFSWAPAAGLSNTNILSPTASPPVTTKYYLTASTGNCSRTDSVIVFVTPAPVPDAGKDTAICFGADLPLHGSGGTGYSWTPSTWLDNPALPDPIVVRPLHSISYTLQVTDANGCRSVQPSVIKVDITPLAKLFAGNDTSVSIGQPLQLVAVDVNNSGFTQYAWSPPDGLSDPLIRNPLALPGHTISYEVTAATINGCSATAGLTLKVYKTADIYVPGAFTPNGDGKNDIFRPLPVGIRHFDYFIIFNRRGQEVFRSTDPAKGWDGRFNGAPQSTNTFIWAASGTDYLGNRILRKGAVVLIR